MQEQVMLSSLVQRHIAQLADHINPTYQETWPEREKINDWEWENDLDFSILGLIDINTTYIAGYASQIATNGKVQNPENATNELREIQFFNEPYFVNWYFSPDNPHYKVKSYVELLDHLRLSALEYVTLYQNEAILATNGTSVSTNGANRSINGTSMCTNAVSSPTPQNITTPHLTHELEIA